MTQTSTAPAYMDTRYGYTSQGNKVHMGFDLTGRTCIQGPAIVEVIATTAYGNGRDDMFAALIAANVRPSRLCGHCFAIKTRAAYNNAVAAHKAREAAGNAQQVEALTATRTITQAIRDLALPSGWTAIADLRDTLSHLTRAQQDELMIGLAIAQTALIIPVANLKALTQRDRDAALPFGGRLTHAIRIR